MKSLTEKIDPRVFLVASRALAALGPSLIALLVFKAEEFFGDTKHAISFCNVLFVGNACAALTVGFWFGFGELAQNIRTLKPRLLAGLLVNGCFAAALSTLIFMGLQHTSVTNAVLLARFGPVIYALVGALLLKQKIRVFEWLGFALIGGGVLALVLKSNDGFLNKGDLFIVGSSLVYAATSLVSKLMLSKECELKTVVFTRNMVSSIVFFAVAVYYFGFEHFSDAFAGPLWLTMSVYSLFVIVLAQFLWYIALQKLDSKTIGKWTVLSPVFGTLYAFLLNGENPSWLQMSAFAVIAAGVLVSSYSSTGKRQPPGLPEGSENSVSAA